MPVYATSQFHVYLMVFVQVVRYTCNYTWSIGENFTDQMALV